MTNEALKIGGISASDLFTQITATGISQAQATILVADWLLENAGRTQRVFNYKTDFPAVEPDAVFEFQRIFNHQDWVDGSSVVQAEESTGEEGFNRRFHNIERDIDNLSVEVSKAVLNLAEMRSDLRVLLDEIRSEINLLNKDVFDLSRSDTGFPPWPIEPLPGRVDLGPRFVGVTKFFDKNVNVWQTTEGLIMLPGVTTSALDPANNPRIKRASSFARFVEEDATFRPAFAGQAVTKERVLEQFGNRPIGEELFVRDALAILPAGARFNSVDAMVDAIGEREAAALRTSGEDVAAISSALGVGQEVTNVAEAPVTRLEGIPQATRTALVSAGFDTVDKLARATPAELATRLQAAGVRASAGEAAGWTASARTLVRIR
jgi:hypothetical protein